MGLELEVTVKKVARFVKVEAAVRYDDEDIPHDAPMRQGDMWRAVIDLDRKKVVGWPLGQTLAMESMKVCDEGVYTLYDENMVEIARRADYVPNALLPGDYGDYLSLHIDENGVITNWDDKADLSDFEEAA